MKILLTGATGFIGSHLLKALLDDANEVAIIKRSFSNAFRIENELSKVQSFDIDKNELSNLFEKNNFDAIIHTAVFYSRQTETFLESFKANVVMPLTLLDLAHKTGVRSFINTGSMLPLISHNTTHDYVLSKSQFVQWAKQYSQKINVSNIVLDYIYGDFEDKVKFLPFLIDSCVKNVSSIDLSKCEQKRDFIFVDDVVKSYIKVLSANIKGFSQYEIGFGKTQTLKDVAITVKELTQSKTKLNFGALPYRSGEPSEIKTNPTNILSLGWKPETTLEQGIKQILKKEYGM